MLKQFDQKNNKRKKFTNETRKKIDELLNQIVLSNEDLHCQ